jgi:type VI protein secretion system component Hcp
MKRWMTKSLIVLVGLWAAVAATSVQAQTTTAYAEILGSSGTAIKGDSVDSGFAGQHLLDLFTQPLINNVTQSGGGAGTGVSQLDGAKLRIASTTSLGELMLAVAAGNVLRSIVVSQVARGDQASWRVRTTFENVRLRAVRPVWSAAAGAMSIELEFIADKVKWETRELLGTGGLGGTTVHTWDFLKRVGS